MRYSGAQLDRDKTSNSSFILSPNENDVSEIVDRLSIPIEVVPFSRRIQSPTVLTYCRFTRANNARTEYTCVHKRNFAY